MEKNKIAQMDSLCFKKATLKHLPCETINFIFINERKCYLPIAGCVFNHIVINVELTQLERLYYFLTDLYAHLNEAIHGLRETEKSARQWADLLGCSEEYVFQMQKKLEKLGYFHIIREKDEDNQNEKNIIIPTLPNDIFRQLEQEPNRKGKEYLVFIENNHEGYKRSYLDNSKTFIKFNLSMIKMLLIDSSITSLQKIIWLYFFCRSYTAYIDTKGEGTRNFITNYKELAELFNCKEATISVAMKNLEQLGYISKKQFYLKDKAKLGRRKKKSCWETCALFPEHKMELLLQQPDRYGVSALTEDDKRLYGIGKWSDSNLVDVSCSINYNVRSGDLYGSSELYNKYNISNINKNTDQMVKKTTNKTCNVSNVSIAKELTISTKEVALGLEVADKFDNRAFALEKNMSYEHAVKQSDRELSPTEHWLVTKTAFTLQQQYANAASNGDLNNKFTAPELRLIELWHDFSDVPVVAEQEEFLLRKSWLMKLFEAEKKVEAIAHVNTQPTAELLTADLPELPGDKKDKAIKFAKAIRERGLAKGYAAEIEVKDLAREFIHHAATWIPERLNCKSREEQIDAALSFAWRAAEQGRWKCPYVWLNSQIKQREINAASWGCRALPHKSAT